MPGTSSSVRGHACAMFCVAIWGATYIVSKILLNNGFSPYEIMVWRFAAAYIILFLMRPRRMKLASWRDETPYAVCGFFGVTLYFFAENTALLYTLVSNVGILVAFSPFFTALLNWLVYKERPSKTFLTGFLVAMVGVVLVTFNGSVGFTFDLLGNILALLAALTWAFYSVSMRSISETDEGRDSVMVTRRVFFWGLLTMVPCYFIYGFDFHFAVLGNFEVWGSLVLLALLGSAFCYVIWNYAIRVLGGVRASAYLYAIPALTMFFAALILHEPITASAVLGIVLITVGLTLSERVGQRNLQLETEPR